MVRGKKYPYTPEGRKAAATAAMAKAKPKQRKKLLTKPMMRRT
jgi:hypothetical protein